MAERRAIKSAIWDDTWFGRLSPFEMTVWIGLFSKCADDQGRFQDDAALIRSKLFPFQDIAVSSIEGALEAFDGHVIRYKKGERIAQLVRWFDNQPMQYAVPSNFPPPDGWVDRYRTNYKKVNVIWNWGEMEDSPAGILLWQGLSALQRPSSWTTYLGRLNTNTNPIPNPIPNDEIKHKTTTSEKPDVAAVFSAYQNNIGVVTKITSDKLDGDITEFTAAWVLAAIEIAVKQEKRSLAYIEGILKGWKRDGFKVDTRANGTAKQPISAGTPDANGVIWR